MSCGHHEELREERIQTNVGNVRSDGWALAKPGVIQK
jgi:hypothetical protein